MSENPQENRSNLIPAMHVLNSVLNEGQSADLLEAQTERRNGQSQLTSQECARLKREIDSGIEKDKERKKLTPENREKLLALSASLRPTSEKMVDAVKDTGSGAMSLAKEQAEFFANPTVSAQEKFMRGGLLAAGAAGALWLGKKFVNMGKNPSTFGKIIRGLGLAALGGWMVNKFAPPPSQKQQEKPKERTFKVAGKEVSETEYREAFQKLPSATKETVLRPFNTPSEASVFDVSKIEFRSTDGTTLVLPIEDYRKEIERGAIPKPNEIGLFISQAQSKETRIPATASVLPNVPQETKKNDGKIEAPKTTTL